MRIWIDLANSPHVPFFRALASEFRGRGHEVETTARRFAQTVELAEAAGFAPAIIGGHGGGKLSGKAGNLFGRAWRLARWARGRKFDLAVGHNSYSQVLSARLAGLRAVTLMDYEHQPANHLAFRLASRVVVPEAFPEDALRRFGARASKVRRYRGIKEDVYLADFAPDPKFAARLRERFGVDAVRDALVVVRPPAREALYHRFENELFEELLARLLAVPHAKVMLLARGDAQRESLVARFRSDNLIAPRVVWRMFDGTNEVILDFVPKTGAYIIRVPRSKGADMFEYTLSWIRDGKELEWRFDDRSDLEAVVRIEFAPAVADEILAGPRGLTVDYAVNLWWRRF